MGEEKRYLVYYDERWDCKLFLNYKTQNGNNEAALKEQVSVDLNLNSGDITCKLRNIKGTGEILCQPSGDESL